MQQESNIIHIESISQLMRILEVPAPFHPLIALVDYNDVSIENFPRGQKVSLDFYKVSFKPTFRGKIKYGQGYYDFEEGGLAFLRPKQIVISPEEEENYEGIALYFHPDFIRDYPLGKTISQYDFSLTVFQKHCFCQPKKKRL